MREGCVPDGSFWCSANSGAAVTIRASQIRMHIAVAAQSLPVRVLLQRDGMLTQHPASHADSDACITLRLPCMLSQRDGMHTQHPASHADSDACITLRLPCMRSFFAYPAPCFTCWLKCMHHSASALHAFAAWWHAYASMSRYTSACLRLRIYVTLYVCLSTLTHLCHSMSASRAIAAWSHAYTSMSRYTSACLRLRIYVTLHLPCMLSQRDRMPTQHHGDGADSEDSNAESFYANSYPDEVRLKKQIKEKVALMRWRRQKWNNTQGCFGGGDSRHFGPMCILFLNWGSVLWVVSFSFQHTRKEKERKE